MSGPLQDFAQNPVVMQLGWMILYFLWQAFIVAVGLAVILRCLRNANNRYLAACMALTVLAILPVVTWIRLANTDPIYQPARSQRVTTPTESIVGSHDINEPSTEFLPVDSVKALNQGIRTPRSSETWYSGCQVGRWLEPVLPFVSVVWMAGVLAMGFRLIAGCIEVERIRHAATELPEPSWQARFAKLAKRLNIWRTVRLLQSNQVQGMVQVGWLRPVVLVPVSMLTDLTPQELDALLTHELAHIRRYDYLVNLLQCVVETFLFYHPVIWWVSHVIRTEREHCCDDLAVQICGHPEIYAEALTAANQLQPDAIPLGLGAGGVQLMSRIERICQQKVSNNSSFSHRLPFVALIGMGLFITLIIFFIWKSTSKATSEDTTPRHIYLEKSLDHPDVNQGPEPILLSALPFSENSRDCRVVGLKNYGQLLISSRIHRHEEYQEFQVNPEVLGLFVIKVIPQSEGFRPYLVTYYSLPEGQEGSDGDLNTGRGGLPLKIIDIRVRPPQSWIRIQVYSDHPGTEGDQLIGDHADYLVHIYHRGHQSFDWDPDTLGVESSLMTLDSSGCARVHSGKIRARMPAIDWYTDVSAHQYHGRVERLSGSDQSDLVGLSTLQLGGDIDTFQIRTISKHPLKFTVDGNVGELDPYVRVYNSDFQLVDEAPKNSSRRSVTLTIPNTNPGQLYYLAVSSYDPKTEGIYMVQVHQRPEESAVEIR